MGSVSSRRILRLGLVLLGLLLAGCGGGGGGAGSDSPATPPPAPPSSASYKLIQVGGTVPTVAAALASRTGIEQSPFDGIFVALQAGRTVFRTSAYLDSALAPDRSNLPLLNSSRLTDNFLLMRGGAESGFDRFSDTHWAVAAVNVQAFASMARLGNLKGIAFDPEAYGTLGQTSLFDFRTYTGHTFAACQANLRLRGRQVMTALQQGYPDSCIFLFGGLGLLRNGTTQLSTDLSTHPYGLLPDFLNGMLDVIAPGMRLVDGGEASYVFYRSLWYSNLRTLVASTAQSLVDSVNRAKYQQQMSVGFSVYLDDTFDLNGNSGVIGHWLSAADQARLLEYQAYWGLGNSDRYFWVYSERVDWYSRTGIPAGAENALVEARSRATSQQDLPFSLDPVLQTAAQAGRLDW